MGQFKCYLFYISVLTLGTAEYAQSCSVEDLKQKLIQASGEQTLKKRIVTADQTNIEQWGLRVAAYEETLRMSGFRYDMQLEMLMTQDPFTRAFFHESQDAFSSKTFYAIQDEIKMLKKRWAAYDQVMQNRFSSQVVKDFFRNGNGFSRELMNRIAQNAHLDVTLDRLLMMRDQVEAVHGETQAKYDVPEPRSKQEHTNLRMGDKIAIKGTPTFEGMTTFYLDIVMVMDVIRAHMINNQKSMDQPFDGPLFDGQGFEGSTLVGLGSGYPRMGVFLGLSYPNLEYNGYEIAPERVQVSQQVVRNLELTNVHYEERNLNRTGSLPEDGNIYFIYDSFGINTRDFVIDELQKLGQKKSFYLVVVDGYTYDLRIRLPKEKWLNRIYLGYSRGPYGNPIQYGPDTAEQVSIFYVHKK